MTDNWEQDSLKNDAADEPQYQQFRHQKKQTPAGEKGLWSILDSVARQSSHPEQTQSAPKPVDMPPPQVMPPPVVAQPQHFAQEPVPVAPEPVAVTPEPVAVAPEPVVAVKPVPPAYVPPAQPKPSSTGFGRLFRRQREEPAEAPTETSSLKSLFNRISK